MPGYTARKKRTVEAKAAVVEAPGREPEVKATKMKPQEQTILSPKNDEQPPSLAVVEISPSQSSETESGRRRGNANADGGVSGDFKA